MPHKKLKEVFNYDFIGSLDAEQFDKTLDYFSSEPRYEEEIYKEISLNFEQEYYSSYDDLSDFDYDFNGELLWAIKELAVNHLYNENYDDIARFIDKKLWVYCCHRHSRYTMFDEHLEELKSMLHKEFPRGSDGYEHSVFQSLYLRFILCKIGIDRENFPREE